MLIKEVDITACAGLLEERNFCEEEGTFTKT